MSALMMQAAAAPATPATLFLEDEIRAAYHLALLEWPYSRHVTWRLHQAPDGRPDAAAAFYSLNHPTIIFLLGNAAGVEKCLASADLPAYAYVALFPEHRAVFERFYKLPGAMEMVRMCLERSAFQPAEQAHAGPCIPAVLGKADLPELLNLYSFEPGLRPDPYQFDQGRYLGIFAGRRLLAAAGTHFISEAHSFAMIGNVFTHPDHRRHGLARIVVAGLLQRLRSRVARVCLNVRGDNHAAVKLYESMGFAASCTYREGTAVLAAMPANAR